MGIDLRNMDCMDLMKEIPDKHYDLTIVDPPYGININSSGRVGHYGGKGKKWDEAPPPPEYFIELERVSKNRIIWGGNYFTLPPCRGFIIWDKQQPDAISFASCEYAWTSFDRSARTFYLRPQNADEVRIHPTQKPIALYKWLLKNYATPGQKIFDTHLGSGSIAIACEEMGFDLVASEIDKDYYQAACQRLEIYSKQLRMII